jgi:hypothetical protein
MLAPEISQLAPSRPGTSADLIQPGECDSMKMQYVKQWYYTYFVNHQIHWE